MKYGIESGTILVLILGCVYGIKNRFLLELFLSYDVGLEYIFNMGSFLYLKGI